MTLYVIVHKTFSEVLKTFKKFRVTGFGGTSPMGAPLVVRKAIQ